MTVSDSVLRQHVVVAAKLTDGQKPALSVPRISAHLRACLQFPLPFPQ